MGKEGKTVIVKCSTKCYLVPTAERGSYVWVGTFDCKECHLFGGFAATEEDGIICNYDAQPSSVKEKEILIVEVRNGLDCSEHSEEINQIVKISSAQCRTCNYYQGDSGLYTRCSNIPGQQKATEMVNHPDHYNKGTIEVITFIEAWDMNFNLGSAVKYICRGEHKDPGKTIEDYKKAIWYINREIERTENK